jgi:hypothetical protein
VTSIIPIEGRAVGGGDGGLQVLAPGISLPFADGRYIRRFVNGVLAGETRTQLLSDNVTLEPVLAAENGALQARWPASVAPVFSVVNDGLRATTRLRVIRLANQGGGGFFGVGFLGTPQAPTQVTSALTAASFGGNAVNEAGGLSLLGLMQLVTRENVTAAACGSEWHVGVNPVGGNSQVNPWRFRANSTTIGEIFGGLAASQIRATSTARLRNPADTATLFEWNATGLGFFGAAPIARPSITGSRGGNAALASLLTQGASLGLWIDNTTA